MDYEGLCPLFCVDMLVKLWIKYILICIELIYIYMLLYKKGGENVDKLNEPMLTVKEVAIELNFAEITIRQWIQHSKIKSVKIAGSRRIPKSEVDRLKRGE